MVSVVEAKGPYQTKSMLNNNKTFVGELFDEGEKERASQIASALSGLEIWEAENLLDRMKCYIQQSIFVPNIKE